MAVSTGPSIVTLNGDELNSPVKRHKVAKLMKITRGIYILPTKDSHQN